MNECSKRIIHCKRKLMKFSIDTLFFGKGLSVCGRLCEFITGKENAEMERKSVCEK